MKGVLVLVMVLYHWLNYFSESQGFYKYLRFLTPSFIFITGFLISSVYLSRYDADSWKIPKRLLRRGLKLLLLFIGLNLTLWSFARYYSGPSQLASRVSLESIFNLYVVGNTLTADGKIASFYVLLPISYLLVISAGLLVLLRFNRYTLYWAFGLCMLCALALYQFGNESANLELLAIGLMGVLIGCAPLAKITGLVRQPLLLIPPYLLYTLAITIWDTLYPLQVIGVLLNLALIYWIADSSSDSNPIWRCMVLLGKYSLFGYIAQLAILQLLGRGLRFFPPSLLGLGVTFVAAPALTVMAVVVLDRARTKAPLVNTFYTAVFA